MKQKLLNMIISGVIFLIIPWRISALSNPHVKKMNNTANIITEITNTMGNPETSTTSQVNEEQNSSKDFIIFSKSMGWGPCPPGQKCNTYTQLWKSGRLIKDGELLKTISKAGINKVIDIIRKNNLLTLQCPQEQINDLTSTYIVSDGVTQNMLYTPLCKSAFQPIEKILGI